MSPKASTAPQSTFDTDVAHFNLRMGYFKGNTAGLYTSLVCCRQRRRALLEHRLCLLSCEPIKRKSNWKLEI